MIESMYNDGSVYLGRRGLEDISDDMVADAPTVRWKWHHGDREPMVQVIRRILLDNNGSKPGRTQWRIRYPEVAPPGARYELIVDEDPPMTPEQAEVVRQQKAEIFDIWQKEQVILNRLLSLWVWDPLQDIPEAVAFYNGDRWISYENNIPVSGASFYIHMEVTTMHIAKDDHFEVEAEISLRDGDKCIELKTIKLPVQYEINGSTYTLETSVTPLVEYLKNSPLRTGARNLSKLAKKLCT